MLGKAASIIRPKTSDKCNTVSPSSKPPMIMIVWGSIFAGAIAWLTVTVIKLQRQLMIIEGLIATRKSNDSRRPVGGKQPPHNPSNPLDGALGQLFGRRAPPRQPSTRQTPKQPTQRMQPPAHPAPMPPQKSLDEIDSEDEINSDDERVQEIPPKMETLEEGDEDEEVPN